MWRYVQSTGRLYQNSTYISVGYSGFGIGRNNPQEQATPNVGPIPCGQYTIAPPVDLHVPGPHGPFVLPLLPNPANEMFGRSGFLIHGDAIHHPGDASHGCIILRRATRDYLWASGDRALLVVAREAAATIC